MIWIVVYTCPADESSSELASKRREIAPAGKASYSGNGLRFGVERGERSSLVGCSSGWSRRRPQTRRNAETVAIVEPPN